MRDLQKLAKYAARRKRSRLFRGILTGIAAVVVFCTTYALILPAITLEGQTAYCGFEGHEHSDECYQLVCGREEFVPHYHSQECRNENGELVCHQEETTIHVHSDDCKVALTCQLQEQEAHQHSEGCFETRSVLVCTQEETPGHTHDDGCYQTEKVCGMEETPGHSHDDSCYQTEKVCDREERPAHAHTEGCYAEDGTLVCTQEETEGHSHTDQCFTRTLVCTQEEAPGHSHTDPCFTRTFICTQEETQGHTHTEDCYQEQPVLICEKEEGEGHTHGEGCYGTFDDFRCGHPEGKEVHEHTASCYYLACDAHVHTEECYVKPQEEPSQVTEEEEILEEDEEEIIQEDEEEIVEEDEEEIIEEDEEEIIQEDEEEIVEEDEEEIEEDKEEIIQEDEEGSQPSVRDLLLEIYTEDELQELLAAYPEYTLEDIWTMLNTPATGEEIPVPWQSPSGGENGPTPQNIDKVTTTDTLELENYLTGVTTYLGPSYKEDQDAIELGMKFSFTFLQDTDKKFPSYDYDLLLKNIDLSNLVKSNALVLGKEYPLEDAKEGTYWFEQKNDAYYLHVKLNEDYVADATQKIEGTISFAGQLDETKLDSDGVFDSSYTNSTGKEFTLHFTPKDYYGGNTSTTLDYQISTSKTGGCVDGNKLRYTVRVTTTKGTPAFTFTDNMTIWGDNSGIINQENKSIAVKKVTKGEEGNSSEESVNVTPNSWSIATNGEGNGTTADISMELPALEANEYYEITYEYSLSNLGESYNYSIGNTASVEGEGDKGQTVVSSSGSGFSLNNNYYLEKSGSYDDGKNTGTDPKVHWEIKLNNTKMDIADMELTDDMFESGVVIDVKPSDGGFDIVSYSKEVEGESKTYQKIVFKAAEGQTGNTQPYIISYDTAATPAYFGTTTQNNTATITKNGVVINKSASASYDSGSISKTLTSMTVPQGGTLPVLNWKVQATVPEGGVKAGTVIADYFGEYGQAGNHQIIRGTVAIQDAKGDPIPNVTVKYCANPYTDDEAAEGQPTYCFKILFNQDYTGGDFTVTYQTRANEGSTGSDKFYNAAQSGKLFSESYNPIVTKDGKLASTDDTITWKLYAKTGRPSSGVITLVDTLPEGTDFAEDQENLKIGVQYVWPQQVMKVQNGGPFTATGSDSQGRSYQYTCWYTKSSRQLRIEIKREDGQPIDPDMAFEVEYTTSVDTQWIQEEMSKKGEYSHFLTNQVQSDFDGTTLLPVSKTIEWIPNLADLEKALGKEGVYDQENHILNYTLKINPTGAKLNPDPDATTLTLRDDLTYTQGDWGMSLIYKLGSVQVYTVDENGQQGAPLPRNQWECTYSDNTDGLTNDNKGSYKIQKTLTLTIPDSMPLIVTYQYDADIRGYKDYNNATDQWIKNNVQLTSGVYHEPKETDTKMSYKAFVTEGSLSTVNKYSFLKMSSVDGTGLAGAEFGIWKAVQTDGQWSWQPVTLTSAGKQTSSYTSGSDGTFAVSKSDGYEENVLYMIKEVKAPRFFQLPSPVPEYRFFFSDTGSPTSTMPESGHTLRQGAIDLSLTVGMAEIANTPGPTTSITIQKQWMDTNGTTPLTEDLPQSITVSLYRRTAETKQDDEPVEENIEILPGTDNSWSVTLTDLPVEEGKEYYIKEVGSVTGFRLGSITSNDNTFTITNVKDIAANKVSIQVQKTWENGDAAVESVNFQLFRRAWDHVPTAQEIAATDSYAQYNASMVDSDVVTIDGNSIFQLRQEEGWTKTFTDLPAGGVTQTGTEYYSYYIVEEPSSLYRITYTKQEAVSGTLSLQNTKIPSYQLPETGGTGTGLYTLAGLTFTAGAVLGLMKKRKKGERD